MRDRRYVEDLTTQELVEVLMTRRREERLSRLRRMGAAARIGGTVIVEDQEDRDSPAGSAGLRVGEGWDPVRINAAGVIAGDAKPVSGSQVWRDRILLGIECAALVGLIVVVISLVVNVRNINQDWKAEHNSSLAPTPMPTPLIRASVLPGGHKPPAESGGEAQPLGPVPKLVIPTPSARSPTRLVIPSIGVDVPVVEGDDWEQLKKGAGHHIGSANPGERGNAFISGHNDIYGEIFRDLEAVKVGDQITVYAGEQSFRYIVRATRIVEPDDVSVMYPTSTPVLTLLTCYPYMIDSHRIVVISELDR